MCACQWRDASSSATSLLNSSALSSSGESAQSFCLQCFALNCRRDLLSSCKVIAGPADPPVDYCLDPGSLELDPCDLFIQQVMRHQATFYITGILTYLKGSSAKNINFASNLIFWVIIGWGIG